MRIDGFSEDFFSSRILCVAFQYSRLSCVCTHTHVYTHSSRGKGDKTNLGIQSRAYHSKSSFIILQNSEFLYFILVTIGTKRLVVRNVPALCQFTCISSLWWNYLFLFSQKKYFVQSWPPQQILRKCVIIKEYIHEQMPFINCMNQDLYIFVPIFNGFKLNIIYGQSRDL